MDEARRLAAEGAPHGTAVHADEQTAGRGRLARSWFSPPGNLYVTALLRYDLPPGRMAELSFVSALAVADTVDALLPKTVRASLKWPNDVLVGGAKIAGILLEHGDAATLIGIGLDIMHAPTNASYRTTTIVAHGGLATVDGARDILLRQLGVHLAVWEQDGFAAIRKSWIARGPMPGTTLKVTMGGKTVDGEFAGLDEDGALLLDTATGRQRIVAGDVGIG
jgi:BirA family biotin operon repressor/biotin-[acetyl-CoA-carboxylase] ligase